MLTDFGMARVLVPNPFPRSYDEMSKTISDPFTNSLDDEMTWAVAKCVVYAAELREFYLRKLQFERAILLSRLSDARRTLSLVRERFGLSLWLLDAELLLAESEGGLSKNRDHLDEITPQDAPWYVKLFTDFSSQRVERENSYAGYARAIDSFFAQLADEGVDAALAHVRFQALYPSLRGTHHLAFVLFRNGIAPIIDQYLGTVRVLQHIAAEAPHLLSSASMRLAVHTLADHLDEDPGPAMLRQLIQPARERQPSYDELAWMTAVEAYTEGRYAACLQNTVGLLVKTPESFDLYELHVLATLHASADLVNPFVSESPAAEILDEAHRFLARDAGAVAACEALRNASLRLDQLRIGPPILAMTDRLYAPVAPHGERRTHLYATFATPRFSHTWEGSDEKTSFLARFSAAYPSNTTAALFSAVVAGTDIPATVHPLRAASYRAKALTRKRAYAEAASVYRELLPECEAIPPARANVTRDLFDALRADNRVDDCAHLVTEAFLSRPNDLWLFPIRELFDEIERSHRQPPSDNIARPVLAYILYGRSTDSMQVRRVFAAYDQFLAALHVERPTQLQDLDVALSHDQLTFFLRYVCAPHIIDSSVVFGSTSEMEAERIGVCQWLLSRDPANAETYGAEIAKLTRDAALRRARRHVDQSKIYVDVAGLKRSLDGVFYERVNRFFAYSMIPSTRRTSVALQAVSKHHDVVIVVVDSAYTQFTVLLNDLRDRYVSNNAYGLDSYLSIRIRHGTLSGQIRSSFEREALITTRNSEGQYGDNAVWTDRVFAGLGVAEPANAAMARFSQRVDEIIAIVKDAWIQIKGPAKPDGLFDFEFTPNQMLRLFERLTKTRESAVFVDGIIEELQKRTEANARLVKTRLEQDMASDLLRALDDLSADVSAIDQSIQHSPFADAVARCRTNVSNAVASIAAWFDASSKDKPPDFSLQLLCETAVAQVHNCFPQTAFSPTIEVRVAGECLGKVFVGCSDMMFILLENIVKHAGVSAATSSITLSETGARLQLTVRNILSPHVLARATQDAASITAVTPRSGLDSVRREGGTGYQKLHKILRYDLGCGEDYDVRALVAHGVFVVEVMLPKVALFGDTAESL